MIHLAQQAIEQGFWVFPLLPRRKEPLHLCDRCGAKTAPCRASATVCPCWPSMPCHGHRAASNIPAVVDEWWQRWPTANVGISCKPSRLVAIDLDVKHTHPPDRVLPAELGLDDITPTNGVDLFAQVNARIGNGQQQTRIVRTATAGLHVVYRDDVGYKSSAGTRPDGTLTGLGWSIDVRAVNGYVVAPGSVTADGSYELVRDQPPASVPAWLDRWLAITGHRADRMPARASTGAALPDLTGDRTTRWVLGALRRECELVAGTPAADGGEAGRNVQLNRAAYVIGGLLHTGAVDETTAAAALVDAGLAAGLTEAEARKTVRSGLTAGQLKPRTIVGGAA